MMQSDQLCDNIIMCESKIVTVNDEYEIINWKQSSA